MVLLEQIINQWENRFETNTMCLYCSHFNILKSYCLYHVRDTNAADVCFDFERDLEKEIRRKAIEALDYKKENSTSNKKDFFKILR